MSALYSRSLMILALLMASVPISQAQAADQDPQWLDVSIQIFAPLPVEPALTDDGITDFEASRDVRLAEARYLATYLRYRLEASQSFGAVRVLPMQDSGAPLMITGQVLASDGAELSLQLKALDSTGRTWLDRSYEARAINSVSAIEDALAEDDFAHLFDSILRDLQTILSPLSEAQKREINAAALIRYGQGLIPGAFDGYLESNGQGQARIVRLPASNDPLLARIQRIRASEYLFIDVVDEYYQQFFTDIKPVFATWRQVQREQMTGSERFVERRSNSASDYRPGSYYALQESYNNYRWAKVQEQYRDELNQGFSNEVEPTEIVLADSLFKLNGTLEQQYREWRSILAELYLLEYGEPARQDVQ